MIYLITDTHLGHANMVKYCGRPENFTKLIYNNWAKKVRAADTVIHLGDIAWTAADLQWFVRWAVMICGHPTRRKISIRCAARKDPVISLRWILMR